MHLLRSVNWEAQLLLPPKHRDACNTVRLTMLGLALVEEVGLGDSLGDDETLAVGDTVAVTDPMGVVLGLRLIDGLGLALPLGLELIDGLELTDGLGVTLADAVGAMLGVVVGDEFLATRSATGGRSPSRTDILSPPRKIASSIIRKSLPDSIAACIRTRSDSASSCLGASTYTRMLDSPDD